MQSPDIEQLLRVDAGPGPAQEIGAAKADAMIGGALDAVFPTPGGGGAAGGGGVALKMAGVAAVIAAAGVGAWMWLREPERQTFTLTFTSTTTPTITTTTTTTTTATATEPEVEPDPIEMQPEKAPKDKPVEKIERVEDLMAEANAARRAMEWKKAGALYERVVEEFKGTAAAQVALVASATLRLEHLGDARGAAKRFKKAASGPNAEEARYGLAEAYRALGDDEREAEALTEFLRHHGDSPLADRARKRRIQLP